MTARPKAPAARNANLRRMARKHGCQIRWVQWCRGDDTSTTVLAHPNSLSANKCMARKADDHLGVFACFPCHAWLDQGRAGADEKKAALEAAFGRQVKLYEEIAGSLTSPPADRASAQWALDLIRG